MPKPVRAETRTQRLIIEDIGPKGDGIARGQNGAIFIERALPDDEIEAKTFKADDGVIRGSIASLIRPSPFRDKAPCPYYETCGGCSLQHANTFFYKGFKQDIVHRALGKVGLKPRYLETIFCPPRTRRRATFAVFLQNNVITAGYYKRRSHTISAIPDCLVCHPDILAWRDRITPHLKSFIRDSRPCDLFIQITGGAVDVVLTGPVGRKGEPDLGVREAAARLVQETGIARLSWRAKGYDAPEILVGARPIIASFGKLNVSLPPAAFLQPTVDGQDALMRAVQNALPEERGKTACDLFSGCGTFTGALLDKYAEVDAFDIGGTAELARAASGLPVTAIKRDLFKSPLRRDELNGYDLALFDPPRAGCKEQASEIARSRLQDVIGISCNPATFARDARILCDHGFKLETVQIVDQFVWSHHVELVGKFTR